MSRRSGEDEPAPAEMKMARPARQPSQPYDPDAPNSSGTRRSLFPPLWQRFKDQLDDPSQLPTPSGAHVTLEDLEHLAELREAADPVYEPRPAASALDGKISGWVGTPDPSKFVAGTNALTMSEVEDEVSKGNIVMLDDWVGEISRMELWEKKLLFQSMLTDWMQNRFFVRSEGGKKVSFWDLYNYVYHNPELAALAKDRHAAVPVVGSDQVSPTSGEAVPPGYLAPGLYGDPGPGMHRVLDQEAAKQMPWGLAGTGELWRRLPTRWLWGMDGKMDAQFAMYVHEDKAHEILGPKYGGRDPRAVLADDQYAADIMRAGPAMGMAFMLTAARDLRADEAQDAMVSCLARRMQRRYDALPPERPLPPAASTTGADAPSGAATTGAVPQRYEHALGALYEMYCMLDPARLAQSTQLMDASGTRLRPGASLVLCTGPSGKVTVQAMTPGLARERKSYVLGAVQDAELCTSMVEAFLGDGALDAEFARGVPNHMLMFANGFKTGNVDHSPLMRRAGEGPSYSVELIPAQASVFRLPRVGASPNVDGQHSTLLSGVRERQLVGALADLYQRAYNAAVDAAPVEEGARDSDDAARTRRNAAAAVLAQGLAGMGLSLQGLGHGASNDLADQLFADVEPLDDQELAMAVDTLGASLPTQGHKLRRGRFATSKCSA